MKRIIILLFLLLLAVAFVACGNKTDATSAQSTRTTAEESTTQNITTEADTTYREIVYDTTPITGEDGTPYRAYWNPYLLSPAIPECYESAFHQAITAILNRRLSATFQTREALYAVKDNLFYEFPLAALCDYTVDDATLTLHFTYRYDRATHLEKIAAFGERIEEILSKALLFGDDDTEKALLLYHAIAYNTSYIKIDFDPWQTNAYYALTENLAICYSFSDAYNYLLRQVGVEAWLVKGYREPDRAPHAWSLVKIGTDYYHCDTTWEASLHHGAGFYYFGMSDKSRCDAISLENATVGEGILQTKLPHTATGSRFEELSGRSFLTNNWTIDRDRRVLRYLGIEYSYD